MNEQHILRIDNRFAALEEDKRAIADALNEHGELINEVTQVLELFNKRLEKLEEVVHG